MCAVLRSISLISANVGNGIFCVYLLVCALVFYNWLRHLFLGGLHVTNPPIRLMCQTSICLSVHQHFCVLTLAQLCPIEFKLDREIDHHHS